jgi:hypothetical protein
VQQAQLGAQRLVDVGDEQLHPLQLLSDRIPGI